MFRDSALVKDVVDRVKAFRPDAILHHNIYHHFPMAQMVRALDRQVGVPQSIVLHDNKPGCAVYLGLRHGTPCTLCSGDRYWNAVRHRCKDGSLVKSSLLAADSFWNARVNGVYSRFRAVISPSRFLARRLQGIGQGRAIEVLSNPCPPVVEDSASDTRSGVAFVGRLSEEKGIHVLLDLASRFPGTEFHVAGDGPLSETVRERVAASLPNVRLLGRIGRDEVCQLLSRVRFLVLPSICLENNPMAGLEALSRGTPILGSNLGGIPELVEDGRGWLFDPSSPDSVAAALEQALALAKEEWIRVSGVCKTWAGERSEERYIANLTSLLV